MDPKATSKKYRRVTKEIKWNCKQYFKCIMCNSNAKKEERVNTKLMRQIENQ